MRGKNGGSVANFGDASKNENFILRPTHLDVNFPKIFSCVAEILDNLAFQRPKRRSAKNKILQEKTLRQYQAKAPKVRSMTHPSKGRYTVTPLFSTSYMPKYVH
jgi:hypothetical protein